MGEPDFRLIESRTHIQGLISEACQASVRTERARIRRELLDFLDTEEAHGYGYGKDLRAALDRICPEEE